MGFPDTEPFPNRKLHDMAIRLDCLYDIIVELEEKNEEGKLKSRSVEANAITLDNVYKLMINFEKYMIKSVKKNGTHLYLL